MSWGVLIHLFENPFDVVNIIAMWYFFDDHKKFILILLNKITEIY